ncbi:MAG: hypothetical protein JWM74_1528 [Myxococcaceae bacterium]|nr:hypothetical protein [Myxococcaceae bacterium]
MRSLRDLASRLLPSATFASMLGLALVATACSSSATGDGDSTTEDNIIGGVDARGASLNAIGTLGHMDPTYDMFCTATLIAPNIVLTAKHCARPSATGEPYMDSDPVYFGVGPDSHAPIQTVKAIAVVSSPLNEGGFVKYGSDVALYTLETPITDVKPMKIATAAFREGDVGKVFSAVGYGVQDRSRTIGTRKAGALTLRAVSGKPMEKIFTTPEAFFQYVTEKEGAGFVESRKEKLQEFYDFSLLQDYEVYLGLGPDDAQPCSGDSGGPLVGQVNGENMVFAVVSGSYKGDKYPCSLLGESYAAFGPKVRDMIESATGPCAGEPIAGRCDGTTAIRCVADREGPQKVTKTNCALINQVCLVDSAGNAGCDDAPAVDAGAGDGGVPANDAGNDGGVKEGGTTDAGAPPVDAGPG